MVSNPSILNQFHRDNVAGENLSYPQALAIFEGLFQEAKTLGVISSENILDGIAVTIRVARAINQLRHV